MGNDIASIHFKYRRSIKANTEGIKKLKRAKDDMNLTYFDLAENVYSNERTVKKFFYGEKIYLEIAKVITKYLKLELSDVVDTYELNGLEIKLAEDISQFSPVTEQFVSLLQELAGDPTIQIIVVKQGSTIVVIEGSSEGLKRIEELFKSGQLSEIYGFTVENVSLAISDIARTSEEQEEFARALFKRCRREGYSWVELSQLIALVKQAASVTQELIESILRELLFPDTLAIATKSDQEVEEDSDIDEDTDFIKSVAEELSDFYFKS